MDEISNHGQSLILDPRTSILGSAWPSLLEVVLNFQGHSHILQSLIVIFWWLSNFGGNVFFNMCSMCRLHKFPIEEFFTTFSCPLSLPCVVVLSCTTCHSWFFWQCYKYEVFLELNISKANLVSFKNFKLHNFLEWNKMAISILHSQKKEV